MLKYHAFISYSHKDRKWAQWLHRSLESYRVPSDLRKQARERAVSGAEPLSTTYPVGLPVRLRPIFRDRDELPTAADLGVTIRQALEHSHALIVLCSPAAAASKYVDAEIRSFREMDRDARIFALIVEGIPPACFPAALTEDGMEPIAADARPEGDGKKNSRVKLIAGLLGLEYDRLKRRLEARERAETWFVIGSVLTIAAVTLMLAIWAMHERSIAVTERLKVEAAQQKTEVQRLVAEEAKKQAEQSAIVEKEARTTAEKLINEMLFNLRDKLEPIGKVELLDGVSKAAQEYFEKLPPKQQTPNTERNKGVMYRNRGDVLMSVGDTKSARTMYENAHAIVTRLIALDPTKVHWQSDLAESITRLGEVVVAQGDLAGALGLYTEAKVIRARLTEIDPVNAQWQSDFAESLKREGDVAVEQGDLTLASSSLTESKVILQSLVASDPANTKWQYELAGSLFRLGYVALHQGDVAGALRSFTECNVIHKRLTASDPANADWQHDLHSSLASLAQIANAQGDLTGALRLYTEAKLTIERLAASDPANAKYQQQLAVAFSDLAVVTQAQGDLPGALRFATESNIISERLAASDPANAEWQSDLAGSLNRLGVVAAVHGDLAGSLRSLQKSKVIRERLAASAPANAEWQYEFAASSQFLGVYALANGDLTWAMRSLTESKLVLERLTTSDPANAEWQVSLSQTYVFLAKVSAKLDKSADSEFYLRKFDEMVAGIKQRSFHLYSSQEEAFKRLRVMVAQ